MRFYLLFLAVLENWECISMGAAGLSYGTTGPHRVGLVLSLMAEVICFGYGPSGDCRQSNLEARRWLSDLGERTGYLQRGPQTFLVHSGLMVKTPVGLP